MMSINWPVVSSILTSAGVAVGGTVTIVVQAFLKKPEQKSQINSVHTEALKTTVSTLLSAQQDLRRQLDAKDRQYKVLRRQGEKIQRELVDERRQRHEAHEVLRLLARLPILQHPDRDERLRELIDTLEKLGKIIDRP